MKLYIVRHGRTVENDVGIIQGHTPGKLNEEGIIQAEKVAEKLSTVKFDVMYSSDLARAWDTAVAIHKYQDCELIPHEDLRERTFGIYDNTYKAKIKEDNNAKSMTDVYKILHNAPGAESDTESRARAQRVIDEIVIDCGEETVCVVTHDGLNVDLVDVLTDKPFEDRFVDMIKYGNTAVSIFERNGEKRSMLLLNDISHLE